MKIINFSLILSDSDYYLRQTSFIRIDSQLYVEKERRRRTWCQRLCNHRRNNNINKVDTQNTPEKNEQKTDQTESE